MENNTLLGATGDSVVNYDGSGVFNPNTPNADVSPVETDSSSEDSSEKPTESKNNLLMYAGAALLLYFFVFKKK
jgi:hypothetical protein